MWTDETKYEAETCYYLDFHIKTAKNCINKLRLGQADFEADMWDNRCQFYHFWCDHLLFSLGQISNRFKSTRPRKDGTQNNDNRTQHNRILFNFSEELYPITSNKDIRNYIEHIDEYNTKYLKDHIGVGGFNVIFSDSDEEFLGRVQNSEDHPYVFDAVEQKIIVYKSSKRLTLDLKAFENELDKLGQEVKDYKNIIANVFL